MRRSCISTAEPSALDSVLRDTCHVRLVEVRAVRRRELVVDLTRPGERDRLREVMAVVASVPPVVVALGDSLSAGPGRRAAQTWPALLQQRATAARYPHLIVNAGVSGDASSDAVRRLDRALVADTRVLIVALGANDGLRGVPIATRQGMCSGVTWR